MGYRIRSAYTNFIDSYWLYSQAVADVLNMVVSGRQIDIMRLKDGDARSVWQTFLKREAVILPVHILNQRRDFACPLVFVSTSASSSGVTL